MITISLKNKKLLSAEELLDRSDTLEAAIDIFLIDNVLNNWQYRQFEKEYMQRLDEHVREQYSEIADMGTIAHGDDTMRGIYRESEENWAAQPQEIKKLCFDKVGILYHLARQDKPSLCLSDYIAELSDETMDRLPEEWTAVTEGRKTQDV